MIEQPVPNEPEDVPFPESAVGQNGKKRGRTSSRDGRVPPHNLDAERALLGAQIISSAARGAASVLTAEAFYRPSHGALHETIQKLNIDGQPVDAVTVAQAMHPLHLEQLGGPREIVSILAATPATSNAASYARIIAEHHQRRVRIGLLGEAVENLYALNDSSAESTLQRLQEPAAATGALRREQLDRFLAAEVDEHDWIIEGVLERTDRVLLTGPEGGGKSTLLRQIAVQAAAGIHPFTLDQIEPLHVLLLDLENSERHLRRHLRPLAISAGDTLNPARLTIASVPEGLDLLDPHDRKALTQLIVGSQPDLVVGGPVYKLVGGDPTEEQPAKVAAMLLDCLRVHHGFAVALETHQPHEAGGKRPERPYGASLWKRWPEFGLHLAATVQNVSALRHWRGARDERAWPTALQRGGAWPWTIAIGKDHTLAAILSIGRHHATLHGELPSCRDIAARLTEQGIQGASKSSVDRTIKANQHTWNALLENPT